MSLKLRNKYSLNESRIYMRLKIALLSVKFNLFLSNKHRLLLEIQYTTCQFVWPTLDKTKMWKVLSLCVRLAQIFLQKAIKVSIE